MQHMREFLPNTLRIDFVGRRGFFALLSLVAVVVSVALFVIVGPNYGIDFTGGVEVQARFGVATRIEEVRAALLPLGVADDAVVQLGDAADARFLVRVQGESGARPEVIDAVKAGVVAAFGADRLDLFEPETEVGTRIRMLLKGDAVGVEAVQAAVRAVEGVRVQLGTEPNAFYIRLPGVAEAVSSALESTMSDRAPELERTDSIGPRVGGNLRAAGVTSLAVTMALLLVYVALRFDLAYAPGAIACLFHDAVITCGIFVLTRQEFNLSTISALLTLVGYSLNDTIVIYDRIRENSEKYRRKQLLELVNDTMNQMLGRTVMTSFVTALALVPFVLLGGPVLNNFATTLLIGIVIGSYSTVYVASPLMILLKENESRLLALVGFGSSTTPAAKP